MKDSVSRNWKTAFTEVMASLAGALLFLFGIALVLFGQGTSPSISDAFFGYFSGGQIGLSVLSLSGIIFMALRRHGNIGPITTFFLYVFYLGPVLLTAFIIGVNPGFKENILSSFNLSLLWVFFIGLHILWFIVRILEPTIPSAQEAGKAQEDRVNDILKGAANRG